MEVKLYLIEDGSIVDAIERGIARGVSADKRGRWWVNPNDAVYRDRRGYYLILSNPTVARTFTEPYASEVRVVVVEGKKRSATVGNHRNHRIQVNFSSGKLTVVAPTVAEAVDTFIHISNGR